MTEPLSTEERERLAGKHQPCHCGPSGEPCGVCAAEECEQDWPCDASRALASLATQEADTRALRDVVEAAAWCAYLGASAPYGPSDAALDHLRATLTAAGIDFRSPERPAALTPKAEETPRG